MTGSTPRWSPARALRKLPGGGDAVWWLACVVLAWSVLSDLFGTYIYIGLVLADPPSYPPLVERFAVGL